MKDLIWHTKDGKEIPVNELTEEHAKNIVRMILREKQNEDDYGIIFETWDPEFYKR